MASNSHFFPEAWQLAFNKRLRELRGLCLIGLSIYIIISLLSYSNNDPSFNTASQSDHIHNFFGQNGAYLADILFQFFGSGSYIISLILLLWSLPFFKANYVSLQFKQIIYLILTTIMTTGVISAGLNIIGHNVMFKGLLSHLFYIPVLKVLNYILGSHLSAFIMLIIMCLAWLVCFAQSINLSWFKLGHFIRYIVTALSKKESQKTLVKTEPQVNISRSFNQHFEDFTATHNHINFVDDTDDEGNLSIRQPRKTVSPQESNAPKILSSYQLPALDLLEKQARHDQNASVSQKDIEDNADRLIQVLLDFGVKGKIVRARSGPVVTLYEFEPAPGIKSSRIIGLSDDIARSMSALSARIALIPGKTEIGIELPNPKRQMVNLHTLLKHPDYTQIPAALCLALGQNISGEPIYVDLARMPHMIVAGTTGSGKSVGINTMILSLLYHHSPATCRFIMIDPKMLELSIYNDIPHLLTPVVTDPKKAIFALKWTVKEMENRYRSMSHLSVRNIEGYNQAILAAQNKGEVIKRQVQTGFDPQTGRPIYEEHAVDMTPLPYIVVVVDEMADLMMVAGKDIEVAVQRLAQMARAAGIHVIMATQRPSVDVITGTIKANFPTRISFQVTSKFDSKTILGEQGAEQLLGRGDMLLMEAGGKIQRIHGPFVSDQEVEAVVRVCKQQGRPNYIETITQENDDFGIAGFGNPEVEVDEWYQKALEIVRTEKKASASYFQRKFNIGYNRAAKIVEQMEAEGIVSPANHVGKRQILI